MTGHPLIGRAVELAHLRARLDGVWRTGRGSAALVEGEAGIGKTALVTNLLEAARGLGVGVAQGAAEELHSLRPFGAIADALRIDARSPDPRRAAVAALLSEKRAPSLDPLSVQPVAEARAVDATLALIEEECHRGPFLLALEDVHWADASTFRVVDRLGRYLAELPILLVLTYRPTPAPHGMRQVAGRYRADVMHLAPLADHAVVAIAARLLGAEPGRNLRRHLAGAAGNPLYVTELVTGLAEAGRLRTGGAGTADIESDTQPLSLPVTILRRLSLLPTGVLDVLQVASVLGSRFAAGDLCALAQLPMAALLPALTAALEARVLAEHGDELVFRHDLLREALYQDLPVSVRRTLHLQVANGPGRGSTDAEHLAAHLLRGARPGARSVASLRRAAGEIASRAPGAAVELLERALELAGNNHPERGPVVGELVVALILSGRLRDAETTAREAIDRSRDPASTLTLRVALARALLLSSRTREAAEQLELAHPEAGPGHPMTPQVWALAAWCHLFSGALPRARALAEQVLAAGEAADDVATCVALTTLAGVAHYGCNPERARQLGASAIGRADRSPGRQVHAMPLNVPMALFHLDYDDVAAAERFLSDGRRISAEIGYISQQAIYERTSGVADFLAGRWDDARTKALTATYFEDDVSAFGRAIVASAYLGYIELFRGDLRAAEAAIATGQRRLADSGHQYRGYWLGWVHALILEARGDSPEALVVLQRTWDEMTEGGFEYDFPTVAPDLVRLALAHRDADLGRRATEATEAASRRLGCHWALGAALRCRGRLDADPAALRAAVDRCRLSPRVVALALACEDVAELDPGSADLRGLLDEALEIYEGTGASWAAARVRSRLRRLGVRPGARGRRGRPKMGWESLTRTEETVVRLVCEGMSNPQIAEALFLSRHTVRTHVSHVLAKLGLASRTELAVHAAGRS